MPSIVDKLKSVQPDVPDPMWEQAKDDPVRRYLMKQASVTDQQNIIIGAAVQELLQQAKLTNGRINTMEPKVERHEKHVDDAESKKKSSKWFSEYLWFPVGFVVLNIIAKKFGLL